MCICIYVYVFVILFVFVGYAINKTNFGFVQKREIYIYIFIGQHGTFNGADNDKPWDFVDSLVPHVGPKNCTVMSQVCPLWIDLYGTFNDLQPTANIQWPGRVISKLIPKSSCGTVGHQSQADGILSRVDPFFGALFS